MRILTNHVGYNVSGLKKAIIQYTSKTDSAHEYKIINIETKKIITQATCNPAEYIINWKNWYFSLIDFSDIKTPGNYRIIINQAQSDSIYSHDILIHADPIKETISDLLYYFKGQRCCDQWDKFDEAVAIVGQDKTADVHGGWYDASGDVSKYLSHLSYANFMNPQQTPFVVWSMFKSAELVKKTSIKKDSYALEKISKRLSDEALYGADFLVRMLDSSGAFYMTVFDQWTGDPQQRMICEYKGQDGTRFDTWQCAYRQGAGVAIAALAVAGRKNQPRNYSTQTYLETAIKGFKHLEENNISYCNDKKENIIDDYCALLAATELYKTTKDDYFSERAIQRANNLINRLAQNHCYKGWLRADNKERSFSHAVEAGLPVIALLNFAEHTDNEDFKNKILTTVKTIMQFELEITCEVKNTFGYPRQYVTEPDGSKRSSFFIAQKNETGYWWQGENARLASIAAAARFAARYVDSEFAKKLEEYALNCLNWILGLNPYDACMLQGRGYNNPTYEEGAPNAPGGICNGITSGFENENDIDFNPTHPPLAQDGSQRWRWGEQWIPHSAWYILAVSLK